MALRDAHHTMPLAAAVERYLDEQVGLLVAGAAAVRRREADAIHDQRAAAPATVSYTHLTLPTNSRV